MHINRTYLSKLKHNFLIYAIFNNNNTISSLETEMSLLKAVHAVPHVGSFIKTFNSSHVDDVANVSSRCSEIQRLHTAFRGNSDYLILKKIKINTGNDNRLYIPLENTQECCVIVFDLARCISWANVNG